MKVEHIQLETVWRLFWEFENLEFSQNIMPFTQFIVDWNQRLFKLKDIFPQKYIYTGIEFNEFELGRLNIISVGFRHWKKTWITDLRYVVEPSRDLAQIH